MAMNNIASAQQIPDAATDPRINHEVRDFLKEVNKDPSPFWTLPGPQVRATLTGLQNQYPVDMSGITTTEKTIDKGGYEKAESSTEVMADQQAQECLGQGYQVADQLVRLYIDQMFQARHKHLPHLETLLGCYLPPTLPRDQTDALLSVCNSLHLPLVWKEIEPTESGARSPTRLREDRK